MIEIRIPEGIGTLHEQTEVRTRSTIKAEDHSPAFCFAVSVGCGCERSSPTVTNVNPLFRNLEMISGSASAVCHPRRLICMTMIEPFLAIEDTYSINLSFEMLESGSPEARSN